MYNKIRKKKEIKLVIVMAKRKNGYLGFKPIRDIMESIGANVVARDAVNFLRQKLEEKVKNITVKAKAFAEHRKQQKITKEDIELVIKGI